MEKKSAGKVIVLAADLRWVAFFSVGKVSQNRIPASRGNS
jgi:hypothetical protein